MTVKIMGHGDEVMLWGGPLNLLMFLKYFEKK